MRLRFPRRGTALALSAALLGCSGRSMPALGPAQPAQAEEAVRATAPDRALHIVFSWNLQEREGRFSGRGSTRLAPPLHARLDLFGPRGEAYLQAALVEMDLRLPAGAQDAPLPPAALLWAALGVFQPPEVAQLTGTSRQGEVVRLQYALGDERWSFRLENGALRSAEWVGRGNGRRTVELRGSSDHGLPQEAVYRDWQAFRELRLTLEEVHETEGFAPDIWSIGDR